MIEIIKELNVEVTKPNIFQALVAKQYDMNTRFLKVTLMDCGTRINVPAIETAKVVINAERKDGQSKGFDGVINDDGTVTVPLHSWMLALDGSVICDISVIDTATDDEKKLTTTSFTLLVEKAAYGGNDITSDPQYDVLVELMENCQAANEAAQEALDKSNEANAKYEACVEATENANATVDEFNTIKQEVEDGGFIRSIEEINKGLVLRFWAGTQAEYDALEEKPQNCYVIITDENRDFIVEQGTATVSDRTWNYEKWQSGKAICWRVAECEITGDMLSLWDEYNTNSCIFTTNIGFGGMPYPFEFIEPPLENKSILGIDGAWFWLLGGEGNTTSVSAKWDFARPSEIGTNTTIKVSVYVVGRWK